MTDSEHLHVFRHKFDKKDLPSSTTIQSMVEEGHFIVKRSFQKSFQQLKTVA